MDSTRKQIKTFIQSNRKKVYIMMYVEEILATKYGSVIRIQTCETTN